MNRQKYLAALRAALKGLPEEELANALRYYEEYFDDAGEENEQKAIDELGTPESIAAQILQDYRELTIIGNANAQGDAAQYAPGWQAAPKRRGHSLLSGLGIVFLALLLSPILIALLATLIGLVCAVVGILIAVICIVIAVPFSLLCIGVGLIVFAFWSLGHPPSALATFGAGVVLLAIGGIVSIAFFKLLMLIVPPVFRGFITFCKWVFQKISGLFSKRGGESK